MSVQALTLALKCRLDNPGAKLVLLVLANYANEDGLSYPSAEKLVELTDIKRRSVFNHLKFLEEKGLITRDTRRTESGLFFSNVYQLNFTNQRSADTALGDVTRSADINTSRSADSAPNTKERDTKENIYNGEPEFGYALDPLIKVFPHLRGCLTPAQCGQIEVEVKSKDKKAWEETIELYRLNYSPFRKTYLPEKVGNLLQTFRAIRDREQQIGLKTSQKLGTSERAKRNGGFLH